MEDLDDDNDGACDSDTAYADGLDLQCTIVGDCSDMENNPEACGDTDDNDEFECADEDFDGCEDCLSGSYDTSNDGADADSDGQCDIGDVDLALHEAANLISFYALPEDGDNSVSSIFGSLGDNIELVIGQGTVALNLGDGLWVGDLANQGADAIDSDKGYWVVVGSDASLQVQGLPTAPVTYGLNPGNNLISYGYSTGQAIGDGFPTDAIASMSAVYGEGAMALVDDDGFAGSLSTLDAGSGYWVVANQGFTFEYNEPSTAGRIAEPVPVAIPEEYRYIQSPNQFFYFVKEATIEANEISQGDWIVAYNNDVVVGSRQYTNGGMIDVPIMGVWFDEEDVNRQSDYLSAATAGYCDEKNGDVPTIKIHRENGDIVDMYVEVEEGYNPSFANGSHALVTLSDGIEMPSSIALHAAYPNPFNPSTMIEYTLGNQQDDYFVNLSIYDIRGRLVTQLVNDIQAANYEKYQVVWNADMQSSGVYFVRLTAGSTVKHQKIMLIK